MSVTRPSRSGASPLRFTSVGENWRANGPQLGHQRVGVLGEPRQPARGLARLAQEGGERHEGVGQLAVALGGGSEHAVGVADQAAQLALALAQGLEHRAGVAHHAARGRALLVEDLQRVAHVLGERREAAERIVERPCRRRPPRAPARPASWRTPCACAGRRCGRSRPARRSGDTWPDGSVPPSASIAAAAIARRELHVGLAEQRLLAQDRLGVLRDRRVLVVELDHRGGQPGLRGRAPSSSPCPRSRPRSGRRPPGPAAWPRGT